MVSGRASHDYKTAELAGSSIHHTLVQPDVYLLEQDIRVLQFCGVALSALQCEVALSARP